MATAKPIEANRRNAQKSTGPKTEDGKSRSRVSALKHGHCGLTITPVLPKEDPDQVHERTQQWIDDLYPATPSNRNWPAQAAGYAIDLDLPSASASGTWPAA